LPLLVSYIKTNQKLSEKEMLKLVRMFPAQQGNNHVSHHEMLIQMALKYREDRIFGKAIEVVLSDEGRRWMAGFYAQVSEIVPGKIKDFR